MKISFLEAKKIIKENNCDKRRDLKLTCSFEVNQLLVYLEAIYALNEYSLDIKTLPFNTLDQYLITKEKDNNTNEILILCDWDFYEGLNWRRGFSKKIETIETIEKKIIEKYELIKSNSFSKIIYIPFEGIPILGNKLLNNAISNLIREKILDLDGKFIKYLDLSINNFLISGCPFQTYQLSKIAFDIFSLDFKKNEPKKLLITDMDNTFWNGILGENGPEEINADQNGRGYPHFIFQTLLKRFNNNGILICAVSKNDSKDIEEAFKLNKFVFGYEDFVSIIATYEPKSLQIQQLLKHLNLTEDSFIFIDDNDVEINEV